MKERKILNLICKERKGRGIIATSDGGRTLLGHCSEYDASVYTKSEISGGFQHACRAVCHSAVCVCALITPFKASLDVSEELCCLLCLISF